MARGAVPVKVKTSFSLKSGLKKRLKSVGDSVARVGVTTYRISENSTNRDFIGVNDVRIRGVAPTTNNSGSVLEVASWDAGADDFTASLIRPTGISSIPAGNTIVGVRLKLSQNTIVLSGAVDIAINIAPSLRAWVATEATWQIFSTGNAWATNGGRTNVLDYDAPNSLATFALSGANNTGTYVYFDLTSIAGVFDQIYKGTRTNNGVIVYCTPFTTLNEGVVWIQSSGGTDGLRPVWEFDVVAADGSTGSLAKTNNNDTISATGNTVVTGTLAKTNNNDTLAASGNTVVTGSLARTNNNDTLASSGTSVVIGTLSRQNNNDTLSSSGNTVVISSLAKTNNNDTLSSSGNTVVTGTLNATNANDTLNSAGNTVVIASLARTNNNDTLAASGTSGSPVGSLNTTNNNDTLSASGNTVVRGSLTTTNNNDTLSANGTVVNISQIELGAARKRKIYPLPEILQDKRVEPLKQVNTPIAEMIEPIIEKGLNPLSEKVGTIFEQSSDIAQQEIERISNKSKRGTAPYVKNESVQKELDANAQQLNADNLLIKEQQALDLLQQKVENERIEDELAMKKIMQYFMLM